MIPPCYRFPSSFLRFPSPFCLQTSWCWCSWMRKENKKHGVALLYPLRTSAQKKEQSQQAEGTRWGGAHFSVCDIFLGNHSLRSSLCVLRSKAVEPMFFLLLLSIRFHFRLPFVVVDKKQQSSESEGGREREREREREKERGRERERERQRERQTER